MTVELTGNHYFIAYVKKKLCSRWDWTSFHSTLPRHVICSISTWVTLSALTGILSTSKALLSLSYAFNSPHSVLELNWTELNWIECLTTYFKPSCFTLQGTKGSVMSYVYFTHGNRSSELASSFSVFYTDIALDK